jgi:riboflavin biosynthesis pyrimidine reductase
MEVHAGEVSDATGAGSPRFSRLLPAGAPASVSEIIEELGLWDRTAETRVRPQVMLNMISTADGRATLEGRSGTLSNSADRALFHGLRGAVDAVLVGAGTVRVERYGRIIPDAVRRELRRRRGLSDEPLACIVSGRVELEGDIPLLREPSARVVILTGSEASLPASAAHVEYIRTGHTGRCELGDAIAELGRRYGVQRVLCEGGPHLAWQLLAAGLLDELFLTVAPMLAGGEPSRGEALRILAGSELEPPRELELLGVLSSGSELFLRYGVLAA